METRNFTIPPIAKRILKIALPIIIILLLLFLGSYIARKSAYIKANTSNIGIVTDKTYKANDEKAETKYTVTIERTTTNSAGETTTKTETYTISYEDWAQIEEGYIATYRKNGAIDIDPPAEAPADAENTGIVTNKSSTTTGGQLTNVYSVTIERKTFTSAGKVKTTSKTYDIPYEDWLQVEIGHIAKYQDDGAIDIAPPTRDDMKQLKYSAEPFNVTFWEHIKETTTNFYEFTILKIFSNETTNIIVLAGAIIYVVIISCLNRKPEEGDTLTPE